MSLSATPTPAQIEAAAKAVRQMGQCVNIAADDYEEIARIILTAASQVGEQPTNQKDLSRYIQSIGKTIENATIERCAQVAEERASQYDHQHNNQENALWQECLEIAAAIRGINKKTGPFEPAKSTGQS